MTISQAQKDPGILQTVSLLTAYCFDLRGLAPKQVINSWLKDFSALWIRLAVIEALYLGRYKAVSVEHLLKFWHKKGQPNLHFSAEFERLVSRNLPRSLAIATDESMEELTKLCDQSWPLKVPALAQEKSPPSSERKFSLADPEGLPPLPWHHRDPKNIQPQSKDNFTTPDMFGEAPTNRVPGPAPSIEQFIPITQESDLLHRLQLVLSQESENV
ncbi:MULTISPECIES: hypothetical protein [unclassified Synechocystis]|uniref:hypothetical protein n=1 Tax=unclassified Synechocystis TaxID=2640012 RepID=UPI00048D372D|nr:MULTISPECIES: hypothetical protein [unclassified Synechocystis]AIE75118.1 hypothetical protein D082_25890 [Synechocystis sp. PCC 6714]MCT0252884.1 hypothetical protein [Synechocystis sp. CS-94]